MVRTAGFHPVNRGSIPRSATNRKILALLRGFFVCLATAGIGPTAVSQKISADIFRNERRQIRASEDLALSWTRSF